MNTFKRKVAMLVLCACACACAQQPVPTQEGARVQTPEQCRDIQSRGGNC